MNLHRILNYRKITELMYDGIIVEEPVADIVNFDWKNILDPPPSNNSQITIKELNLISHITLSRSLQQEKLVTVVDQDMDSLFKKLLGQYGLYEYPKQKIDEIYNIIRPIILNIKSLWNRPRPYQLAKLYGISIDHINTDTHHTASYPSGHTVYATLVANIIKKIYPETNKSDLQKIVDTIAENRVIQGVHYPSDNVASVILGNYLFNKLQQNFR